MGLEANSCPVVFDVGTCVQDAKKLKTSKTCWFVYAFKGSRFEFKSLLVRLNDDSLEIVFERDVLGCTTTVSAELTINMFTEGSGKMTEVKVIGGKFGSLPVSKNFVGMIRKELENVAKVLVPEKEVLSCLGGINVRDGWLILKPHI